MARYDKAVYPRPGFEVYAHPQPGLHRVNMDGRAVVFGLDAGRQAGNILPGSGFVVDRHAAAERRTAVNRRNKLVNRKPAVGAGVDLHHPHTGFSQRADRVLNARVFKTRDDDRIPPSCAAAQPRPISQGCCPRYRPK